MRSLVVAEQYPWPAVDGYRQRLAAMVAGLAGAGEVELWALAREGAPAGPVPDRLAGQVEVHTVAAPPASGARAWLGAWARPGAPPRRVLATDWSELRSALEARLARAPGEVDLVWFSHVDTWWPLRDLAPGVPRIVDFDNLEHLALRLRRHTPPRTAPGAGIGDRARSAARWAVSRSFDLVDERRWDRAQRAASSRSGAVVVCSELDVERSGCANAVVVGNGAPAPAAPQRDRRSLRGDAPTLLFVGALDYEPNTDAVDWFVREVWPSVRQRHPDARVRIVGRGAERVRWIEDRPGVDLVGPVDDVRVELDGADVSIVPIRVGAGTRLKVVEALANHLPLVTTTVGCEGIDVRHGRTALVADDAGAFADACVELLGDGERRQQLADAGAELFARRYDWSGIEAQVAGLARRVAGS